MQSRQMQGSGVQQPEQDRKGLRPSPLQHNAHPSRPLAIAQAEMQKLGLRGTSLTVQGVARDMVLAVRPGQIII